MTLPKTSRVVPDYPGSSPFSTTRAREFPRPTDLRKSGTVASGRQEFFLNVLVALSEAFPEFVPYQFETPDGVRRLDKGALKFAHDSGDLDYIFDEGRIIGIRLSASIKRRFSVPEDPVAAYNLQAGPEQVANRETVITPPAEPISAAEIEVLETDERARVIAERVVREGQAQFKSSLIKAYGGKCALLNTKVKAALDAAHIRPYLGDKSNKVWNGILLRADLHRLFDAGLLCFEYQQTALVTLIAQDLHGSPYMKLAGKSVNLPQSREDWPARAVIDTDRLEKLLKNTFLDVLQS